MSASRNPSPSRSLVAWSHWSLLGPLPDGWPPPTGFCFSWGPLGTRSPGPAWMGGLWGSPLRCPADLGGFAGSIKAGRRSSYLLAITTERSKSCDDGLNTFRDEGRALR